MSLLNAIQKQSKPLSPIATKVSPLLRPLPNISAVLFDIYGTLFISSSGDVESDPTIDRQVAFADAWNATNGKLPTGVDSENAIQLFDAAIKARHEELREVGTEFPEVDIRDIWRRVWTELKHRKCLPDIEAVSHNTEQFAVEFEVRANPVWPMPGAADLLSRLSKTKRLGLISNAQFMTPALFPGLLGKSVVDFGFDPSLTFYSFQYEQAKPGVHLYEFAANELQKLEIKPEEVLYVGNDMLKDIVPASRVGFKTALFAGDQRSLRMRETDPHVAGVEPDLVVTELLSILEVL